MFPVLPVPVAVTVDLDWNEAAEPLDEPTWSVLERAHDGAPLPSSGIAPRDYLTGTDIATVERTAGHTPFKRIAMGAAGTEHPRD